MNIKCENSQQPHMVPAQPGPSLGQNKNNMENIFNSKVINVNNLFTSYFLDAKNLYLYFFNRLPCIYYVEKIDAEKACRAMQEKWGTKIRQVLTRRWSKPGQKEGEFDNTIIIMENNCILDMDGNYCEILHHGEDSEFVMEIAQLAMQFKERQRRQPLEINMIVQSRHGFELKAMEIKRTKLNLDLFYEDDFILADETIQRRLKQKNDKGIVLLHGLPGTGKTTYLRYLVGKIRKRVLFLSPTVAGNLVNPDFIELLIANANSVLIIEDAENVIMDRKYNESSSVSNLLNISDGLLSDFLNVQLICTFNSSLTMIDNALLRKGRLIAKYEFGKLGVEKANRLKTFGF